MCTIIYSNIILANQNCQHSYLLEPEVVSSDYIN